VTGIQLCNGFRRAFRRYKSPTDTTFGSHVDQPVSAFDHIDVVLDDDDRMTILDQGFERPE